MNLRLFLPLVSIVPSCALAQAPVSNAPVVAEAAPVVAAPVVAAPTVVIRPQLSRGVWQGWGCSFAWWANAVGGKHYSDLYADAFFSQKTVTVLGRELPGLGLNIVRYNVGGGGRGETVGDLVEQRPARMPWFKDIDGFFLNPRDKTAMTGSQSWDWARDYAQRAMVDAAVARGVNHVELFSNAPMWWMMDSKSSAGGHLKTEHQRDFALYLATVAQHAQKTWKWPLASVAPFNEPAAGWWVYPKEQEGANVSRDEQAAILPMLRAELDARGLQNLPISTSDENSMTAALDTNEFFKTRDLTRLIGRVNVHSYSGTSPWRDNGARTRLRQSVGAKPLWASEFGDNEQGGLRFAQTVLEDVNFLRPNAWVYWQPLEASSPWGPINATFGRDETDLESGKPRVVFNKFFVFAQFSRFVREGDEILDTTDPNTIVALDKRRNKLKIVTMNLGAARPISFDLSAFARVGTSAQITQTRSDGTKQFVSSPLEVKGNRVELNAEEKSVTSIEISLGAL